MAGWPAPHQYGSSGVPPLRYYWLSDGAALVAGPLDTVAQPGTGQEITQTRATTRNRNIGTGSQPHTAAELDRGLGTGRDNTF